MKAVYYEKFAEAPVLRSLPDPSPKPGAVVVKVEATGLCRSDWHGWQGHDPDIVLPHVPGHELAGTIVETGAGVRNWKKGDRVTVPFVGGCGACAECHGGNHQVCASQFQPGFTAWGSFAEYVAIDYADTNLVAVPEEMDFATAASLGCRFVTSFRAIVDLAQVKPGEWVAVHGAGGIGLSAIMIANAMGANVIAVDVSAEKLALARELGAAEVVNAASITDVPGAIHALTKGGAHVSMDGLGHPTTCANSILSLRRRGRHVQVGLMGGHGNPAVPMGRIIGWELQLFGSHGIQAHRYGDILALIRAGKLAPQKMIRRRLSLAEAPRALMELGSSPGTGISVIDSF